MISPRKGEANTSALSALAGQRKQYRANFGTLNMVELNDFFDLFNFSHTSAFWRAMQTDVVIEHTSADALPTSLGR